MKSLFLANIDRGFDDAMYWVARYAINRYRGEITLRHGSKILEICRGMYEDALRERYMGGGAGPAK